MGPIPGETTKLGIGFDEPASDVCLPGQLGGLWKLLPTQIRREPFSEKLTIAKEYTVGQTVYCLGTRKGDHGYVKFGMKGEVMGPAAGLGPATNGDRDENMLNVLFKQGGWWDMHSALVSPTKPDRDDLIEYELGQLVFSLTTKELEGHDIRFGMPGKVVGFVKELDDKLIAGHHPGERALVVEFEDTENGPVKCYVHPILVSKHDPSQFLEPDAGHKPQLRYVNTEQFMSDQWPSDWDKTERPRSIDELSYCSRRDSLIPSDLFTLATANVSRDLQGSGMVRIEERRLAAVNRAHPYTETNVLLGVLTLLLLILIWWKLTAFLKTHAEPCFPHLQMIKPE